MSSFDLFLLWFRFILINISCFLLAFVFIIISMGKLAFPAHVMSKTFSPADSVVPAGKQGMKRPRKSLDSSFVQQPTWSANRITLNFRHNPKNDNWGCAFLIGYMADDINWGRWLILDLNLVLHRETWDLRLKSCPGNVLNDRSSINKVKAEDKTTVKPQNGYQEIW